MAFDSLQAFFAMGGYGLYVWPSFIVAIVVVGANVIIAKKAYKRSVDAARLTSRSLDEAQRNQ